METNTLLQDQWQHLLCLLPENREDLAKQCGVLKRKRQIRDVDTLLRIVLAYGWLGFSLRNTAAWAAQNEVAILSDVAVLKQLRLASGFLQKLVLDMLKERTNLSQLEAGRYSVQIVDSSVVNEPGSKGTDWRAHTQFDLGNLRLSYVEVTDSSGAETFKRFPNPQNQIQMGDRGFAHRAGIAHLVEGGGQVIVRINWKNVPLVHPDGSPFDLVAALKPIGEGQYGDFPVRTAPDASAKTPSIAGRLVVIGKSAAATEKARRDIRRKAKENGVTPDARTLETAGYVMLFTTVAADELPTAAVLELYRFRWQIELVFKRMKSLLGLDTLHAHDPCLCKTFLYSKFLAALLIEDLSSRSGFSPWNPRSSPSDVAVALDPDDMAGSLSRGGCLLPHVN
jgi:hypothetical protein